MSATVVGAFTWPDLAEMGPVTSTMLRICWYNSLVLAVAAVAMGMQQSIFLLRIGGLSNGNTVILNLLSIFDQSRQLRIPRRDQVIIWQTPVGMLEFSLYFWLAGFIVFIWDTTKIGRNTGTISGQVVSHLRSSSPMPKY